MCLCFYVSPLDGRVKGHEGKSRRRRRAEPAWMKFSVSCHYVWTSTDHRLRKRERDTERKTRRWRARERRRN